MIFSRNYLNQSLVKKKAGHFLSLVTILAVEYNHEADLSSTLDNKGKND